MRIGIDCRKIGDFGIGTYIRGLLRGLSEIHSPEELVAFVPGVAQEFVPSRFEKVVVDSPNYSIRELFVMSRAIHRARLDLYHSPHFVLPITRCPAVTTLHDVILFRFPPKNPVGELYVHWMTRRAIRKSVRILTVTSAAKDDLMHVLDCDGAKIAVAPNGADHILAVASATPADGRYFLYVGNDKPHKNVDRLVVAFAIARDRDPSLELILVGASFDRFAGRPGVRVEGFVSDARLGSLYRGALAVAIPSLDEGFGLPALEAMALGVPVLVSDAPALVEVTGDGALRVDAHSVDAIAFGLSRLADDAHLRGIISAHGLRRAREFTWRRSAEATLACYREAHAAAAHV